MFSGAKGRTEVKIGRSKSFLWAAIADNVHNFQKITTPDEKRKKTFFSDRFFSKPFF